MPTLQSTAANRIAFRAALMLALLGAATSAARAGDWPQILGPARNGVAEKESLAKSWPPGGPPVLWEREVGSGFAGVAVADGKALLFHRVDDFEVLEAMDAATGKVLWTTKFSATYEEGYSADKGPRCVPAVHKGRAYVYGARGGLHCVDLAKGTTVWSRDTYNDYNSKRPWRGEPPEGYFGFGASPLVEGDKLIVNVGGDTKDAGVVAFDLETGKTAWTATKERASYSSPVAATVDGVRHLFVVTRLKCVSLNPADGKVRAEIPFGKPGPTVNGASPIVLGDRLFLTASYGVGAVWAKIGKTSLEAEWESDDMLSSQYATSIEHEGKLIGLHGRQDIGQAELRCIDPKTEEVLWSKESFGYGSLIKADDKLLIQTTNGQIILAELSTKSYTELARARVLKSTAQALPALSNGRLYVRDEQALKCLDVGR